VEGFEHVVKVAMETEDLIVTSNLKFPVSRQTKKLLTEERQTHGYEVDLVGARRNKLVLASVKSFFGSRGVNEQGFIGLADESKGTHFDRYKLLNELDIQDGVVRAAASQFGYSEQDVELRLYVGKFATKNSREFITTHLRSERGGLRPVEVIGLDEIVNQILGMVHKRTYLNDPVVMTLKALQHAGRLSV
jgi:hypothetical protein